MNLNVYICDGRMIIVDMGISFCDHLGVEIIMPDIRYLEDKVDQIEAIVLTHAHEDHIGAVAHLWPRLRCPIYATPFTAEVVRNKFRETPYAKNAPIIEIPLSGKLDLTPFHIEFVTLTHSIPEPNALKITTKYGTVMHTGDWKLDPSPLVGATTNEKRLKEIGDEGVLALVCDSTNVFSEGTSGSEGDVKEELLEVIKRYPKQRITVACFASNIARMQSIAEAAHATGREIVMIGRSLEKMELAARYAGYLKGISKFKGDQALRDLPNERTLVICTGSQGEHKSALARITNGTHPMMKLDAGDVVIFSARTIPGNEKHIGAVQNRLTRAGVTIITSHDEDIHVSGHPYRDELRQMFAWTRPQVLIPVHGEARHLFEHRRLGLDSGIPQAIVPNNGTLIKLAPEKAAIIDENIPSGRLVIDGNRLIPQEALALKQRHKVAINGHVMISLVIKGDKVKAQPQITLNGICEPGQETHDLVEKITGALEQVLYQDVSEFKSESALTESLRQAARRICHAWFGKKPVTDIHIIQV